MSPLLLAAGLVALAIWSTLSPLVTIHFMAWLNKPYRMKSHHAALHLARRVFPIRAGHVLLHGRHYETDPDWHKANVEPYPHLAKASRQECKDAADRIHKSAAGRRLTKEERAYVLALQNNFNARTVAIRLKGRDPSEFGAKGHGFLHLNSWRAACDCELEHVFDETVTNGPNHAHHPLFLCDKHKHLEGRHPADVRRVVTRDHNAAARAAPPAVTVPASPKG